MADYFSDNYVPRGESDLRLVPVATALPRFRFKVPSGILRFQTHTSRAIVDFTDPANAAIAASDTIRLMTMKSSDRIVEFHMWTESVGYGSWSGTLTLNIGVAFPGALHDGPLYASGSALFAAGIDCTVQQNKLNILTEGNQIRETMRGWALWEVMSQTLAVVTDTVDPKTEIDIVATIATGPSTGTGGAIIFEMIYVPSGN